VFPHEQQNNITYQLANSLQAVVAQRLLPRADRKGLILAAEACIATPAVRKRIRDGEPHLLFSEMQMGRRYQMQTLDASLLDLYQRGEISYDMAISNAREPESIRQRTLAGSVAPAVLAGEPPGVDPGDCPRDDPGPGRQASRQGPPARAVLPSVDQLTQVIGVVNALDGFNSLPGAPALVQAVTPSLEAG
jgi:hypothetical protein